MDLIIYHITWVTHSARVSERMKRYGADKDLHPLILTLKQEIEITGYISNIAKQDLFSILAYSICRDHVHLLIACEENQRDKIVGKLKGKSAQLYKINHGIKNEFHFWAQKYNYWTIISDEQLSNVFEYVTYNRLKHNLEENAELQGIIDSMLTSFEKIFEN